MIWLLCGTSWAANFERTPYLQSVGETQITLMWMSDVPTGATLKWGTSTLSNSRSVSAGAQIAQEEITGLTADTRYQYEVTLDGESAFSGHFDTAPSAGSGSPVRIWVVGDSGTGKAEQADVRDAMLGFTAGQAPDLLLHVGDMAYGSGTELEFSENYFAPYASILATTPMYGAIGNHEYGNSISSAQTGPYFDAYAFPTDGSLGGVSSGSEAYYAVDYGDVHIIVLDSNVSELLVTDPMYLWLEQDLAATSAQWVIAFWHHPPYSKGTHDTDREYELASLAFRQTIVPLLESYGADLVLSGHSHIYERSFLLDGAYDHPSTTLGILDGGDGSAGGDGVYVKPLGMNPNQGAVYVVAGHGGKSVGGAGGHPLMAFTEREFGSVILDVSDTVLSIKNVRIDGQITDHASLVKGDALLLGAPNHGVLKPGATQRIAWESVGSVIGPVTLEWSCDGGDTWRPVTSELDATGEFLWTLPAERTDDGVFRVSAASGHQDRSDSPLGVLSGNTEEVMPLGSVWAYLDAGTAAEGWQTDAPASWKVGSAPLGYGANGLGTAIDDFVQPSVYFRRQLTTPELTAFEMRVEYNDGVIVWLDGVELMRANVDDDLDGSYASSTVGLPMLSTYTGGALSAGTHELAVMLKQDRSDGADLLFDMSMDGTLPELVACNDSGPTDTAAHTGSDSDKVAVDTSQPKDSDTEVEESDLDTVGEESEPPEENPGCGCGSAGGLGLAWAVGLGVLLFRRRRG